MRPDLQKYVDYIVNTGQVPLACSAFDEDWEPVGPRIRQDLVSAGIIEEYGGALALTMLDPQRLPVWALYDHPTDYPDEFVARAHYALPSPAPTHHMVRTRTLEEMHARLLVMGLHRRSRGGGDDPKIIETWL